LQVSFDTTVKITANWSGVSKTFTLALTAPTTTGPTSPVLSALACSPMTIAPGASSTCTVTLSTAAPAGGMAVALSSNNSSKVTLPASVTVAAGSTTANFSATAVSNAMNGTAKISATAGGVTLSANLTVKR